MDKLSIKQLNQKIAYSKECKSPFLEKMELNDIWKSINIGMNSNNNYASNYAIPIKKV